MNLMSKYSLRTYPWTRVNRPDMIEYRATIKGIECELYYDEQVGVTPGWVVRINPNADNYTTQDIPVKGRKDSKIATLHRNVLEALR